MPEDLAGKEGNTDAKPEPNNKAGVRHAAGQL